MFKKIPVKIKEEILLKVKNGTPVADIADQYGISPKTIYGWLRNKVRPDISIAKYNKLKKDNEDLKRIIGLITLELERGKKLK